MEQNRQSIEIPSHLTLMFSGAQILSRVKALGDEITPWALENYQKTKQDVLAVCVLRGGAFFFADLLRSINASVDTSFCRAWSYSSVVNQQEQKGVRVAVDEVRAEGRAILIVDDICDTGATLKKLHKVFLDLGALDVRSAVLVHRMIAKPSYLPNWSAFTYEGDEWFVGYGMEERGRYRNLEAVYTTKAGT